MSKPRPRALLAEVARLYYLDRLSQDEIAARLSMTRSNVSRILEAARDAGVVEFTIVDTPEPSDLQAALAKAFKLSEVRVVADRDHEGLFGEVAAAGADLFLDAIRSKRTVAVSWGSTLQALVESITPSQSYNLDVVQLVGGLVSLTTSATAQDLVRELSTRLGARYHYLNSPAIFESTAARNLLLNERSIHEVLEKARHADVALVGIGNPREGSGAIVLSQLRLSPSELEEFRAARPVGDICGRYFDVEGEEIRTVNVHDRILAVEIDDLRSIPSVIGVAFGQSKATAILGALHARVLDVLVCDSALAQRILSLKARYDVGHLHDAELDFLRA